MKCACGVSEFDAFPHPSMTVDEAGRLIEGVGQFVQCRGCGLVRQGNLPFDSDEEYVSYYKKYPPTRSEYVAKSWEHDLELAQMRCDAYGIGQSGEKRILDVGSGSGAFVYECRQRGKEAYGCEIGEYSYDRCMDYTYRKRLEDAYFPTDHFDLVVSHDVLEHSLDPLGMLAEIFRITKQNGCMMLDVPRFFHPSGTHHWKDTEHVWAFTTEQVHKWLVDTGFVVKGVKNPIDSKDVFYCEKPEQKRPKIVLPPGIGDAYWSIVKMRAFLKREKLGLPDVYIAADIDARYSGHTRTFPYIEMFPFVHASWKNVATNVASHEFWGEVYAKSGRTIVKNVGECDYMLSYNGHLRYGEALEKVDPDLACEWAPPMFVSLKQDKFRQLCEKTLGRYIVFYYGCLGTNRYWQRRLPLASVACLTEEIGRRTGCRVVMIGAKWDFDDPDVKFIRDRIRDKVDFTGKTTTEELFGLIRGAEMIFGCSQGVLITAAMLGKKSVLWWDDYYHDDCPYAILDPKLLGKTYFPIHTRAVTQDFLVSLAVDIINDKAGMQHIIKPTTPRCMAHEQE